MRGNHLRTLDARGRPNAGSTFGRYRTKQEQQKKRLHSQHEMIVPAACRRQKVSMVREAELRKSVSCHTIWSHVGGEFSQRCSAEVFLSNFYREKKQVSETSKTPWTDQLTNRLTNQPTFLPPRLLPRGKKGCSKENILILYCLVLLFLWLTG